MSWVDHARKGDGARQCSAAVASRVVGLQHVAMDLQWICKECWQFVKIHNFNCTDLREDYQKRKRNCEKTERERELGDKGHKVVTLIGSKQVPDSQCHCTVTVVYFSDLLPWLSLA